jgi:hypothetical protein
VGLLVHSLSVFVLVEHFSESLALKLGHFISIIGVTTVCESLGSLVHLKYGLIVLLFDTTVPNTCLLAKLASNLHLGHGLHWFHGM